MSLTTTPFGELKKNPLLADKINDAIENGLTEERAEAVMQSAGKLSYDEEKHIDGLIEHAEARGASKVGLLTLKAEKLQAAKVREEKLSQHRGSALVLATLAVTVGPVAIVAAGLGAVLGITAALGVGFLSVVAGSLIDSYGSRK